MFTLTDFKKTRFYQETFSEGKEEGKAEGKIEAKVETIPNLVQLGLTIEQIATALNLDVKLVKKIVKQN